MFPIEKLCTHRTSKLHHCYTNTTACNQFSAHNPKPRPNIHGKVQPLCSYNDMRNFENEYEIIDYDEFKMI